MNGDRYDLPPNDPDQRPDYRRARGVLPDMSGKTPEQRIRELRDGHADTLEDALTALRMLSYRRRRHALDAIERRLCERDDYRIAWPDALIFLTADIVWVAVEEAAALR